MIDLLLPVHQLSVGLSIILFIWRGGMMWMNRPLRTRLWRRTLPDTVDTVLLSSGILMAFLLAISPLESGWLAAKIGGLLCYIVLGAMALTYGRQLWLKRSCFIAALGMFAYIIAVAGTRQVVPWL